MRVDMNSLDIFYAPAGRLRATSTDRSWLAVRPFWAAPLSHPNKYLVLLDGKNKEIATIEDPSGLPPHIWEIFEKELSNRYLGTTIESIESVSSQFGVTFWKVHTNRGERTFVTQSLQENAQYLDEGQLLITDVEGNRFTIDNLDALDAKSRKLLSGVV